MSTHNTTKWSQPREPVEPARTMHELEESLTPAGAETRVGQALSKTLIFGGDTGCRWGLRAVHTVECSPLWVLDDALRLDEEGRSVAVVSGATPYACLQGALVAKSLDFVECDLRELGGETTRRVTSNADVWEIFGERG